jgi:drug/metabolite transporter (DMT)-like permease
MAEEQSVAHRLTSLRAPWQAWAILLIAGLSWGATYSLAKIATKYGAEPLGVTLWQGILGAAILGVVETARRRKLPLDRRHLGFYLLCGLLGTVIPSTLYYYAAPHLPAGVLGITAALVPLLTFGGAALLRLERVEPMRLIGVILGIIAVLMIALPETSLPEHKAAIWVAVALGAALSYAAEAVAIALWRPPSTQSLTLLCGMMVVSTLTLVPAVLATATFVPLAWPWSSVEWAIVVMAAINVFSYSLFVYLVSANGPVFASQMAYVVTISGVLWGLFIFEEHHSLWIWGALAVMLMGLALVTPRSQESGARNQEPGLPDS